MVVMQNPYSSMPCGGGATDEINLISVCNRPYFTAPAPQLRPSMQSNSGEEFSAFLPGWGFGLSKN